MGRVIRILVLIINIFQILIISKYFQKSPGFVRAEDEVGFSREAIYIIPRVYLSHPSKDLIFDKKGHHEEFGFLQLEQCKGADKLDQLFSSSPLVNFHSHALYFRTHCRDSLMTWLEMFLKKLSRSGWLPLTVFHWPEIINCTGTRGDEVFASICKAEIRQTLMEHVVPLFNSSVDVHHRIYFIFYISNGNRIANGTSDKQKGDVNHGRKIPHEVSIWEIYFINGQDDSNLVIEEVMQVDKDKQFSSSVANRGDMRQTRLTVIAPNARDSKSELDWRDAPDNTLVLQGGQSLEILKDFSDSMNFRFVIIEGDWLGRSPNGTTIGETADLLRHNKVDLMIGQTVPISVRAEVLDYLLPTSTNSLRAFLQQPPASNSRNLITTALQPPLPLIFLGTLTLLLISVRVISWILMKTHFKKLPTLTDSSLHDLDLRDFGVSFMWITGMVTQQGTYLTPKPSSLRTLFITASLTGLVCYIAYAAVIVSVLSMETVPIQNLTDLFQSKIPIYASDDSVLVDELVKRLLDEGVMRKRLRYLPVNLGVHFTFEKPMAYIIYAHKFHTEQHKQGIPDHITCDIIYSYSLTKVHLPSSMAVPKGSPFRKHFNHRILSMAEGGLLNRYQTSRDVNNGLACPPHRTRYRADLGLEDVSSAIILLVSGFILCILLFMMEHLYLRNINKIDVLMWLWLNK